MAEHNPGEKYDAEPLNKVIETSYNKARGGPEFGGAELASDGPVVESNVRVTAVPGSPAAESVFAGLQGDAMQGQQDNPAEGDNTGQDMLKPESRHRKA